MTRLPLEEAQRLARSNHRATVRYRCAPATSGKVFLADDQELRRAWVMNLSKQGIGVLLPRPVPVGAYLTIQMRASQGAVSMTGHVVHATLHGQGEWLIGCEFMQPLNDDELEELL
ncbi:MAG: PilZ domain-containing protein [Gemmataceae bacterium]|nr:PilZ domain-containing protein [Gemmataceae bacterium]